MRVTLFKSFKEIDKPFYPDIDKIIDGIRSGKTKEKIEAIRQETDESKINALKKELPVVLYAGKFDIPVIKEREDGTFYKSYRTDESLSIHSKIVCFDIDDVDDVARLKADMSKDPYIMALWVSPSGSGLHGLMKIADGNRHDEHYSAILKKYPQFDPTARNPSRVLFFSYDPDIYVNWDSKVFFELQEKEVSTGMSMTDGFTDYKRLGIAAKMIRMSEQGGRHNAVIKASYLVGGLISGGIVEEYVGKMVLEHEVYQKFSSDERESELKAVADGIQAGKYMPISDVQRYEDEVWQEVGAIEEELSFLSDNRSDEAYIRKYRAGLIPMGKPFGYFDMDKHLLLNEGHFYALLSHTSTGKTQITLWLIFLSALKYDWCWVIYTGENKVASVKMRFIEFYTGFKIKDCPEDFFQQAVKWLGDRIFFINNDKMHSYEEILEYTESVSKYHAVRGLLIDPVNSLRVSGKSSKYEHEMEMYTNMLLFTKRTNITIFLSVHTRSESQRQRDKDGNQPMPYPADADGGSVLVNKVDIFMVMNRNVNDPETWMVNEIKVVKHRTAEFTGGSVTKNNETIRIRMNKGVEFVDDYGSLPFERDYLKMDKKLIDEVRDEDIEEPPF